MRVAIDATPLLVRSAGVKNYLWHWVRALRPHLDISLFPWLKDAGELDHQRFNRARVTLLYASWLVGVDPFIGRADVFHATNLVRKRPRRALVTATLHDLTVWRMPQFHTPANIVADKRFGEVILRHAAGVIAVSEATRRDAVEVLGLAPERITVIHSGVAEPYFTAPPRRRSKPYVLFVGTIEPRKNLDRLLDAWDALPRDVRQEYELVLAGPSGWGQVRPGTYTHLGYVPEVELPSLTAGATAFCYPSLYEGFGFPVAQAMAAGVPVITSNVSSLPEVAGDGAVYVDPLSTAELTTALTSVLTSPSLREQLGRAGRDRASRLFRWDLCARRSAEFFRSLG
jgi:glycosyltransferase involved in cell wall biosynthesis